MNIYYNPGEKIEYNEYLIHTDFAEKYSCKLSTEIQSKHFHRVPAC